jgi:hypothetical protein
MLRNILPEVCGLPEVYEQVRRNAGAMMDSILEELKQAVESAIGGLSNEQLSWRPAGKWCAAEILEHLYLTYTGTIKGFEKMMQSGKPVTTPASTKQRLRKLVVLGFGYLPAGRVAPANTRPKGLPVENVRSEVGATIAAMDAIIAECEDGFGRGFPLLDHPVLGELTGRQWRRFHLVHGRHHVNQILRMRAGTRV